VKGKRSNNKKAQAENIAAFLEAYERCGMIRTASRAVGIAHNNHLHWLATVPGYTERFAASAKVAEERLGPPAVSTLYSIAVEGTLESVRDKDGNQVWDPVDEAGNVIRPDDKNEPAGYKPAMTRTYHVGALQFLLKSLYPDQFGDKAKVSLTGANGGPVQTETTHKFDHARFADLFRSRFGGDGTRPGTAPANGN
jgi:hypothetical protein